MNYEYVTKANCQCVECEVNKFVNWRYELTHRQLQVLKQFHWKESDSYGSQGKQVPNGLNQDWSIVWWAEFMAIHYFYATTSPVWIQTVKHINW